LTRTSRRGKVAWRHRLAREVVLGETTQPDHRGQTGAQGRRGRGTGPDRPDERRGEAPEVGLTDPGHPAGCSHPGEPPVVTPSRIDVSSRMIVQFVGVRLSDRRMDRRAASVSPSNIGAMASWYVGRLVEVPGVFSQGTTLDELVENIQDAYELMITQERSPAPASARRRAAETGRFEASGLVRELEAGGCVAGPSWQAARHRAQTSPMGKQSPSAPPS